MAYVGLKKMMEETPLLTVEDHFLIEGRGLIVVPLLDVPPEERRFKPFSDTLLVCRPDGTEENFAVNFMLEHFTLRGGGSRWNVTPMIPEGTKETIPIGSKVFITAEAREKLKGEEPNQQVEDIRR